MVWAAITLAFFGFLRIGELTCDSHFNSERHLTFSELVFMPKSSLKIYAGSINGFKKQIPLEKSRLL